MDETLRSVLQCFNQDKWGDHDVAFYQEFLNNSTESPDFDPNELISCPTKAFAKFVDWLQFPSHNNDQELALKLATFFMTGNGLVLFILAQKSESSTCCHHIVKLHDIWSNAELQHSSIVNELSVSSEDIVKHVLCSTLTAHLVAQNSAFVASLTALAMSNYSFLYPDQIRTYVDALERLAGSSSFSLTQDFIDFFPSSKGKEAFFKSIFIYSKGNILREIEGQSELWTKMLLSSKTWSYHKNMICFLSRTKSEHVLVPVMRLWADPVIAKAHVSKEVVHFTKLLFLTFVHCKREEVLEHKQKIIEQMAEGLPNHFNSTDYRTVNLAKMMCDLLTETLKTYEPEKSDSKPEFSAKTYLNDGFCLQLLQEFDLCCERTKGFWLKDEFTSVSKANFNKPVTDRVSKASEDMKKLTLDSDDDDSDLEPIESNEPPSKVNLVYIRDFLENEYKTYDEMEVALKTMPKILECQLQLEHVQVAKDVLDSMFRWENEFDVPALDVYRHQNLCTILKSTPSIEVCRQFCNYFHLQYTQPSKKNLILDVLSTVTKQMPLKRLTDVAKCAFNLILNNDRAIQDQDASVKVPMVLFFGQLMVSTLPKQLVEEEMVVTYLKCLNQLPKDGAIEQCVKYVIHNLTEVIEHLQAIRGENRTGVLQSSISDTKSWLCQIQSAKIDSL